MFRLDYKKIEPAALLFFTVYAVGLTAGSLIGGDGGLAVEPERGLRYFAASFFRALPFFALALLPGKKSFMTAASVLSAALFGCVTGIQAVQCLLSLTPFKAVVLCYIPRLLAQLPVLLLLMCTMDRRHDLPWDYATFFQRFFLAVLLTIFTSCVQFAIFFFFTQFY